MFLIFREYHQPRIVLSLFLKFCQIWGSCSYKIVLIKKSVTSVWEPLIPHYHPFHPYSVNYKPQRFWRFSYLCGFFCQINTVFSHVFSLSCALPAVIIAFFNVDNVSVYCCVTSLVLFCAKDIFNSFSFPFFSFLLFLFFCFFFLPSKYCANRMFFHSCSTHVFLM